MIAYTPKGWGIVQEIDSIDDTIKVNGVWWQISRVCFNKEIVDVLACFDDWYHYKGQYYINGVRNRELVNIEDIWYKIDNQYLYTKIKGDNMQIVKRDGSLETYQPDKIRRAVLMASDDCDSMIDAKAISATVSDLLVGKFKIGVDELSDLVEEVLCGYNASVARAYIRYRQERDALRQVRARPDSRWLADYIDSTKYCRVKRDGYRETWSEAVDRVCEMHVEYLGDRVPESEIRSAFDYVQHKHVLPSMRSLQFGGKAILTNHNRMYNCRALCMDRIRAFSDLFYLLLCGCGVGYSVQWCHVDRLPPVKKMGRTVMHWTIDDTIEGWAEALRVLVEGYFVNGLRVEFNYSLIRPEGSLLKTSGGVAPGHLGLKEGLERIKDTLDRASGRQLRPIEVSDINCYSALAVLSGGVRRSSLIGLFSASDTEMMYSKCPGNFDPAASARTMANISCVIGDDDYDLFVKCIKLAEAGYGEPGYYFSDDPNMLCNPCGEIRMDCSNGNIGCCNLTTINAGYFKEPGVIEAASFIGTLQAAYTEFKYVGRQVNAERDRLLGVGICGLADHPEIGCSDYRRGAERVLAENERVAGMLGINVAARATDIAPNGTSSLSLGSIGAGCHSQPARRYLRRVTANPNEEAFKVFKAANEHMCREKENGDWVIEFPVQAPDSSKLALEGKEHLDTIQRIYKNWVDGHNVSATIVTDDPLRLADQIWEVKSPAACTFVGKGVENKYPYAPRQPVLTKSQEARWNEIIENYKPVDYSKIKSDLVDIGVACEGSKCLIRRTI